MFGAQHVAPRASILRTNPFGESPHHDTRRRFGSTQLARFASRDISICRMSSQEDRLEAGTIPNLTPSIGPGVAASRAARAPSTAWSPSLTSLLGRRFASSTTATLSEDDGRQTAGRAGSTASAGVDRKARTPATADWLLIVVRLASFLFVSYPACR